MADIAPAVGLPAGTTLDRVAALIAEVMQVEPGTITAETDIAADLGGDSLDVVEIAMDIEHQFSIQITDDEIEGFDTVGDVVALIDQRTGRA